MQQLQQAVQSIIMLPVLGPYSFVCILSCNNSLSSICRTAEFLYKHTIRDGKLILCDSMCYSVSDTGCYVLWQNIRTSNQKVLGSTPDRSTRISSPSMPVALSEKHIILIHSLG